MSVSLTISKVFDWVRVEFPRSEQHYDAIFYVTSPFQLMCAFEARERFALQNTLLVLVIEFSTDTANKRQLTRLVHELGWTHILSLKQDLRSKFFSQLAVLSVIKCLKHSRLFLGEYSSFGRALIGLGPWSSLFLLDDGTATIAEQYRLSSPKAAGFRRHLWDWFRDFRFRIFGYSANFQSEIVLFSTIVKNPVGSVGLIRHSFENLRAFFGSRNASSCQDYSIFVGGDLGLDEKNYDEILRCAEFFLKANCNPVYMLHRDENEHAIQQRVLRYGYSLYRSNLPIELEILFRGKAPSAIVGTISTALITLKSLFPQVRTVAIDIREFWPNTVSLDRVYSNFKDRGIEIVRLKENGELVKSSK